MVVAFILKAFVRLMLASAGTQENVLCFSRCCCWNPHVFCISSNLWNCFARDQSWHGIYGIDICHLQNSAFIFLSFFISIAFVRKCVRTKSKRRFSLRKNQWYSTSASVESVRSLTLTIKCLSVIWPLNFKNWLFLIKSFVEFSHAALPWHRLNWNVFFPFIYIPNLRFPPRRHLPHRFIHIHSKFSMQKTFILSSTHVDILIKHARLELRAPNIPIINQEQNSVESACRTYFYVFLCF